MKKITITWLLILFITCINAQVVDTVVLKNYSNAVLQKVYTISAITPLTNAEQASIASLFKTEEDEIAKQIKLGASATTIQLLQEGYLNDFHQLLPTLKLDAYYKGLIVKKANTMAVVHSKIAQKKFNVNTIFGNYYQSIYGWRENMMEYAWLRYANDDTIRHNNLLKIAYTYDTLITRYDNYAQSNQYLNQQIDYLLAAQTVDKQLIQNLADSFGVGLINEPSIGNIKNFNKAIRSVFNSMSDSAIYYTLYKDYITETYQTSTMNVMNALSKANKLSNNTLIKLLPIVSKKEMNIALINIVFDGNNSQKQIALQDVTNNYQPLIDSLLARDASFNNGSQIDIAIRLSLELNLDDSQIENLTKAVYELNEQKLRYKQDYPESEFDSKAYEASILSSVLSEEQYTNVLVAKFSGVAANMTKLDWEQIIKTDIVNMFDSTNTKIELTNYHTAVLVAYHRNAHNKEEQYNSIKRIQEIMPEVLRLLFDKWNYKTPYSDTPDTFFQW